MDPERMIRGSKPEAVLETEMVAPRTSEIRDQWAQVRSLLRHEFGETAYATWLSPLELMQLDGDRVVITVPTQFMREWVVNNYADRIRALWSSVNPTIRSISLNVRTAQPDSAALRPAERHAPRPRVVADNTSHAEPERGDGGTATPSVEAAPTASPLPDLTELGATLDPRFTFDTFIVGKPNEFAFAAAERMAATERPPFNPLFLYGGVGLGKTHLMHAIGWQVKRTNPNRRVVYLSAEKFMVQFIRALKQRDTMGFKELFRSVDLLMVDDVQFISGKDSTQEEFFHTFNALAERGSSIVISADRSPSDLAGMEERIRSRLGWGLVADIHPTTYELRVGILQAKAEQLGAAVQPEVFEFLAHRITSNVRELEGALNRVCHQATLLRRPVSIDMAQDVLKDLLRSNERRVTIEEIQRAVVEHYQLKMSDMASTRRARAVARPRQVAMYLAKQLTPRSLPEIGKKFGGRDHTTVMHAVKQIEKLSESDRSLADDVIALRRKLSG
jgi:chromosomal replication initiator protein